MRVIGPYRRGTARIAMLKGWQVMKVTEDQASKFAEFVTDIQGGDAEDVIDGMTLTADPMTSFGKWHAVGTADDQGDFYGHAAVHYTGVQVKPGETRKDIFVMDLGDFRAVYAI